MKTFDNLLEDLLNDIQTGRAKSVLYRNPEYALKKRARVAAVLKAYSDLSQAAKAELIRQLNRVNSSNYSERQMALETMRQTLDRVKQIEPQPSGCPCCGYVEPRLTEQPSTNLDGLPSQHFQALPLAADPENIGGDH